jgi:ubiquinone/menaquinone biosynthesis C-methylase UbiE
MKTVSFDRAVGFYDQTRGFPPGVGDLIANSVAHTLAPSTYLLEIGVGTGRIARHLLARGFRITGLDISVKMMQQLRKVLLPDSAAPDLLQADASNLPLASQAFDAVFAVHVLHLIPNWQQTLDEIRRVLKPGGCLLAAYRDHINDSQRSIIRRKMDEILQQRGSTTPRHAGFDFNRLKDRLKSDRITRLGQPGIWLS